jgi:hypothetical protein
MYICVAALSILITLLEGYPWLSVQQNDYLDPTDPYSQMFSVTNQGYIPLTDIAVHCTPNFHTSTFFTWQDVDMLFPDTASQLAHAETVTLPCFKIFRDLWLGRGPVIPGATLRIDIEYAFYHLNMKTLRRSQSFWVRSVAGKNNSQHWEMYSPTKREREQK